MKLVFLLLSVVFFLGCNPSKNDPAYEQLKFIEKFVDGKGAYQTVATPDRVEAWLLTRSYADGHFQEQKDRSGPVKLETEAAKIFSEIFLNYSSYSHAGGTLCKPDYGVRLRFTRGDDTIDFRLCYECDKLQIIHNWKTNGGDFRPSHNALVKAIQIVFPEDQIVKELKIRKPRNK